MKSNTALSSILERNEPMKTYDYYCKKLLSHKQILAHILKECVPEFKDIPLEDIPKYIENDPNLGGETRDTIEGKNTEDAFIPEALIKYDILFDVALPQRESMDKEWIEIIINVEAQKKDNPGYPLSRRALYYCCRLISRQKNAEDGFTHSNFNDIKKVYSIWLCFDHAAKKDEAIDLYDICKKQVGTKYDEPKENYDIMTAIIIYPGRTYDYFDDEHSFLELLNILFMSNLSAQEKKAQMRENYGILVSEEVEKEVESMCNLSEGIAEKAMAKEKINTTLQHIKNLMKATHKNIKEVMDLLGVEQEIRPIILETLEQDNK